MTTKDKKEKSRKLNLQPVYDRHGAMIGWEEDTRTPEDIEKEVAAYKALYEADFKARHGHAFPKKLWKY